MHCRARSPSCIKGLISLLPPWVDLRASEIGAHWRRIVSRDSQNSPLLGSYIAPVVDADTPVIGEDEEEPMPVQPRLILLVETGGRRRCSRYELN